MKLGRSARSLRDYAGEMVTLGSGSHLIAVSLMSLIP